MTGFEEKGIVSARKLGEMVARDCGMPVGGSRLIRQAGSTLVHLPQANAVVRVEPLGLAYRAERQVALAQTLAAARAPTVRLAGREHQPVVTEYHVVTIWEYLDAVDPPDDEAFARKLGEAVRSLHASTSKIGATQVLRYDPFRRIRADLQIAQADAATDPADLRLLHDRADELEEAFGRAVDADPLGQALIHGDLNEGNAIATARGVVLIDLERAGVGPRSLDLAVQRVRARRFGMAEELLDAFIDGYGDDSSSWPGMVVLEAVYELDITAWALSNRRRAKAIDHEAAKRMRRWLEPDAPQPTWTLL